MVDRDRLLDLIDSAQAYLADVVRFRDDTDRERFLADVGEQYRLAFPLQQSIQRCIDLAAHLVAGEALHRPDTLAGLFAALSESGRVDDQLAERLAEMARFRNLLVHEYARIDASRVWDILQGSLDDISAFLAAVGRELAR